MTARHSPGRPGPALAGMLMLASTVGCSAQSIPDSVRSEGEYVDATCASACFGAADEAALFADTALQIASDWLGVAPGPAGRLHLARDEEEYTRIERRTTGGRFRSNLAFSSPSRGLSVVAVQPPVDDSTLELGGLPMQTLRLAAHEASHLASYRAMPPPRRVPSWLEEGLATFVEAETRIALGRMPASLSDDPLFSTYYLRTSRAAEEDRLPPIASLLDDRAGDLTGGELYAVRAVIFRGMVETDAQAVRTGLQAAIAAHREGESPSGVGGAFVAAFGGERRIRAALDAQLRQASPRWDELSRSLDTSGEVWRQHPFANGAHAVRTEAAGDSWSLNANVRLRGSAPVAAVTLRHPGGLWGFVRVSRDALDVVRDDPREVLASVPLDPGGVDDPTLPLRIEVFESTLRVVSGDLELGPIALPVVLSGPWGLFAGEGGWVEWEDVRFEPEG